MTALVFAAVVVYLVERLCMPVVSAFLDARVLPKPSVRDAMPVDLVEEINRESEGWARDQARQSIMELYDEHRDWTTVRRLVTRNG